MSRAQRLLDLIEDHYSNWPIAFHITDPHGKIVGNIRKNPKGGFNTEIDNEMYASSNKKTPEESLKAHAREYADYLGRFNDLSHSEIEQNYRHFLTYWKLKKA